MARSRIITSPDAPELDELCRELAARGAELDASHHWPAEQLRLCGEAGVFEWFLPRAWGGQEWSDLDIARGYLRLSAECLTTTFIITQRSGACRRIADGNNEPLKRQLLPDLVRGTSFATVGISHLTTSRRHLAKPVLHAEESAGGFLLDGFSPWVTGARHADTTVIGATLDDGRQILIALPMHLHGVTVPEPAKLVGLSASATGEVRLEKVLVPNEYVLAGPVENVMSSGVGAGTGGVQTSTLAVGLATAALAYLEDEAKRRPELSGPFGALESERIALRSDLLAFASGEPVCSNEALRQRANSLVLRSTQAALGAAKGTGYVIGHPTGRWCREALFFLVWSCPQPVLNANLCELAGFASGYEA